MHDESTDALTTMASLVERATLAVLMAEAVAVAVDSSSASAGTVVDVDSVLVVVDDLYSILSNQIASEKRTRATMSTN